MEKFTICVIYKAKNEQARADFLSELESSGALASIRAEDGCLRYDYYNSVEDKTKLVLFEEWQNKACQEVHMAQPHMKIAMEIKSRYIDSAELKQIKIF